MKEILILLCVFSLASALEVSVSVIPQAFFVKKIAGDLVSVNVLVEKGKSPETYEPNIKQLTNLSKSALYFRIGMPFEDAWLARFQSASPNMKIIAPLPNGELEKYLESFESGAHNAHESHESHAHHESGEHKSHAHESHESHAHESHESHESHTHNAHEHESHTHPPHIWLSFILTKAHAKQIAGALMELDSDNKELYAKNLEKFLGEIDALFLESQALFKDNKKSFLVFHPAFGFIAQELGIKEFALEEDGKEAKISHTKEILELIKENNISTIFIHPQFAQKNARAIASQANVNIDFVDPLAFEWLSNIREFLQKVARQ